MRPLVLLLAGCTLGGPGVEPCDGDRACRSRFGMGSVCGAEGYCEDAPAFPRCVTALPLVPSADPVVIGTLFNASNSSAVEDAARLAFVQAMAAGGLTQHDLALVQCDYGPTDDALTRDEAVLQSVAYLTDTLGAEVIVGASSSSTVATAWEVLQDRDTVLISPSATSPGLTFLDGESHTDETPGRLWRTVPPDTIQGKVIASDIREQGDVPTGLIHDEGPYGVGLRDIIAVQLGDDLLMDRSFSTPTLIADHVIELTDEPSLSSMVMVASSISDVVAFVDAVGGVGDLGDRALYFPDVGAAAEVGEALADNGLLDRVRGTRPAVPTGPQYEAFSIAYRAEYGGRDADEDGYTAYAYDAMWLAIYGLVWAEAQGDVRSADDVGRGLRRLSEGPAVDVRTVTLDTVRQAFAAGESVDIRGASGDLDYDDVLEETTGAIEVWTLEQVDGDVIVVPEYVVEASGAGQEEAG